MGMTSKSPTPPRGRVSTAAHTINPTSGPSLNTAAPTNPNGRGGLVASSGWAEVAQVVADPAAAAAIAVASGGVAKAVVKETGAIIRQKMSENTNRQIGAPSPGPASTGSDGQA